MALTKSGFKRETFEDILARAEANAKQQFGEDFNTTDRSAAGKLLRVWAYLMASAWQDVEHVHVSGNRRTAEGRQLDALVTYAGITRNPATNATGQVEVTGTVGVVVPEGFTFTKDDETLYVTLNNAVIASNGKVLVDVMAIESGVSGNAEVGQINKILNPVDGITAVTNPEPIIGGKEEENDVELRARAELATEGQGSGTTASIRTELLKIPDVRAVFVDENYGDETNEFDTPPNNLQVFVLGGSDEEIAQAIHRKRAGGIRPFGLQSVQVLDASGVVKTIGFTRAETIQVHVRVTLTTNPLFTTDGADKVKSAIVQYVGGLDSDGTTYAGLSMGETVVLSKVIAQVYRVNGIDDVDIELSIDDVTYERGNITLALHQVAQVSAATSIEVV